MEQTEPTATTHSTESPQPTGIVADSSGKYRWVYEQPMLKSLFLLMEVWKVLAAAALAVGLFASVISLISGGGVAGILDAWGMAALTAAIIFVLSVPAYLIVTKANNGKYTVLFEMDDSGVDHIQIKTDAAKALDLLVIFTGLAAQNRVTTASGMLSASGGSLYSRFSRVRRITGVPAKHLIALGGPLFRNQVYADDADFEFVWGYIVQHCPDAKVVRR